MLLSYKPRLLLAVLLASLALPPCWALPADNPPKTPPKQVPTADPIVPGAPSALGKSTALKVSSYLSKWMQDQSAKFAMAPYTKGGVEGWVQFEFEYATKNSMKIPIEKTVKFREENVYQKSALAADWVFDPDIEGNTVSTKGQIVELKVESSTQTGKKFTDLVKKDQDKVSGGLKPAYQDYDTAVLAIAWNKDTQQLLDGIHMVRVGGSSIKLEDGRIINLYEWSEAPTANPPSNPPSSSNLPVPLPIRPPPAFAGTGKTPFKGPGP